MIVTDTNKTQINAALLTSRTTGWLQGHSYL